MKNNAYLNGYLEGYMSKEAEFDIREYLGDYVGYDIHTYPKSGPKEGVTYKKRGWANEYPVMPKSMEDKEKALRKARKAFGEGGTIHRVYEPNWKHYTGAAGVGGAAGAGLGALFGGGRGALIGGGLGALGGPALLYLAKRMGWLRKDVTEGPM